MQEQIFSESSRPNLRLLKLIQHVHKLGRDNTSASQWLEQISSWHLGEGAYRQEQVCMRALPLVSFTNQV